MVTKDDLQQKRTPAELHVFVEGLFQRIKSDKSARSIARLKKGLYKVLVEEVYPLSVYCNAKYPNSQVLCQPVLGNQGHDAIIESPSGDLIEVVELTWPIDGQKEHIDALKMNTRGWSDLETWDINSNTKRISVIDRILDTAKNKALKDYSNDRDAALVFVLNLSPYFDLRRTGSRKDLNFLIEELKKIEFKVNSVFLLTFPDHALTQII